jgi:hypothetical protein
MKTRLRAIRSTRSHTDVLVSIGPDASGRTKSAGQLHFTPAGWQVFRDLISGGLPDDISTPLIQHLEEYIEDNFNEELYDCQKCYTIDDEHEDTCPVLQAKLLLVRLRYYLRTKADNLQIEE